MVMILTKTRESKGADSVTRRTELHTPKMSQGPTLFSCGIMENDRWRDLSRKCPLQIEQPSAHIWDCLADKSEEGSLWQREAASTCSVTNLIKDLSLSDHNGNPSAPPSKRQCRSLSFSDEMSSCRTSWRPLGSKVWTPVEKRRCYSGGSVQRYSNGFTTMQRSSSFSLPSRSNTLSSSCDASGFSSRFGCQTSQGMRKSATCGHGGDGWGRDRGSGEGGRVDMQRSLSCSHDPFSSSEYCPPSASSTPASTPELARRSHGLSRSRSQPCVLNDKKVGVKRRRPEEVQEQRPSLDLAKMTQNHRMGEVGRHLWRSPSPTPPPSRVTESTLHRIASRCPFKQSDSTRAKSRVRPKCIIWRVPSLDVKTGRAGVPPLPVLLGPSLYVFFVSNVPLPAFAAPAPASWYASSPFPTRSVR
ncbi:protein FAM53B isoform X2 [Rhea pennata]|uniref:protein FAM53B isoform X2 n=1 Tax=Rhea pennata TaxID=8795 RepID=UPI002E2569D8